MSILWVLTYVKQVIYVDIIKGSLWLLGGEDRDWRWDGARKAVGGCQGLQVTGGDAGHAGGTKRPGNADKSC